MILPSEPGLQRRLAYANYIRNRHRRIYNTYSNNSRFSFFSSFQYHEYVPIQNGLSIEKLRSVSTVNVEPVSFFCPICQETNDQKDFKDCNNKKIISRTLSCNHTFHISCIETWLSNNTTCPMCRFDLSIII